MPTIIRIACSLALLCFVQGMEAAAEKVYRPEAVRPDVLGDFKQGVGSYQRGDADPMAVGEAATRGFLAPDSSAVLGRITPDRVVRGAKETQLYRRFSRSVVLILTEQGLGTGTVTNGSGDIITNYHVVKGFKNVGVIFKPVVEGQKPIAKDIILATVVKVDQIADLALIRVPKIPAGINPIAIGADSEVSVGDDVHAIGHPTGESWSYTKGVISQIRQC